MCVLPSTNFCDFWHAVPCDEIAIDQMVLGDLLGGDRQRWHICFTTVQTDRRDLAERLPNTESTQGGDGKQGFHL